MTKASRRCGRLALSLLLGVFAGEAAAEEPLMVWTRPLGAVVELDGETTVRGRSPVPLFADQVGEYRVVAASAGYETVYGRVVFRNRDGMLRLEDSESFRRERVFRSLLLPGLGQFFEGRRFEGGVFAAHSVAALTTALVLSSHYQEAHDEYAESSARLARLAEEGDPATLGALHATFGYESIANRRLRDRNWAFGALGVYCGLNLIDAAFMHPSLDVSEGSRGVVQITLTEKTGRRAATRSALYPGLGQSYLGRPFAGALYTALFTASGVTAVVSHLSYKGELDRIETLDREVAALVPGGPEEAALAREALADRATAVERSKNDKDRRDVAVIVTAGVYLASIVDALLGARSGPAEETPATSVGVLSPGSGGEAVFGVRWRF